MQAHKDVLLCRTSCEECFNPLHPTLLEGARVRGCCTVVKRKRKNIIIYNQEKQETLKKEKGKKKKNKTLKAETSADISQ
jgi:hypothetical protein